MKVESAILQAILVYLGYLENRGELYFFRNNSFSGFIQRYNGTVGRMNNSKPGTPDIVVCYKGKFVGLEVKTKTGKLRPSQLEAKDQIEKAGGYYFVVRSLDECMEALERVS